MDRDPNSWLLVEADVAGREHADPEHARRYDAKMDSQAAQEVALLEALGVAGADHVVVEFGTGTGQFAMAAAAAFGRVIAVDVSPVMLAQLKHKVAERRRGEISIVEAGFLTYEHSGDPVDAVYSRYALHHLPDFWKAVALARIAGIMRPGGVFRLWDVVYSFEPAQVGHAIEAALAPFTASSPEEGWTRAEVAEHIREEHSTFAWLLEPMLERVGFTIVDAQYSDDLLDARYVCRKT